MRNQEDHTDHIGDFCESAQNEEQLHFLLQIVEQHRKHTPFF